MNKSFKMTAFSKQKPFRMGFMLYVQLTVLLPKIYYILERFNNFTNRGKYVPEAANGLKGIYVSMIYLSISSVCCPFSKSVHLMSMLKRAFFCTYKEDLYEKISGLDF